MSTADLKPKKIGILDWILIGLICAVPFIPYNFVQWLSLQFLE